MRVKRKSLGYPDFFGVPSVLRTAMVERRETRFLTWQGGASYHHAVVRGHRLDASA